MFGKLKEKLKEKLSIFSRKAKEEVEEKNVERIVEKKVEQEKNIEQITKTKIISAEELLQESIQEETEEEELIAKPIIEKKAEIKTHQVETPEIKAKQEEKKIEIISKQENRIRQGDSIRQEEEIRRKDKTKQEERVRREDKSEINVELRHETKPEVKPKQEVKTELRQESKPDIKQKQKEDEEKKSEQEVEQKSFFGKIKQALTTKTISAEKFEELFWELEVTLLENNVSVEVIEKIKEDLKQELINKPLPRDVEGKILETLKRTLSEILDVEHLDVVSKAKEKNKTKKPYIIAFFGINGAGKTTSIAKLTKYFQKQELSVVLAACDTFRAAAIQQLQEHADALKVKMIKQDYGSDAAAVAFDAIKYAEKNSINVVLIDTAGRLHSNTNLMAELEKLIRVSKPDLKIFVGESITGNDCIEQARQFNDLVEQDGIILTKADVDEKGGAPLSISYVIKKPILFLGMGQRYEDLEEFNKEKMLQRLGL
ncbi:signal recognition particle-docking protein FtsY [Candidatus Woesearchaeota archaeon]|nr:signal recognition particle-docking protein FtsY [Candidatus Woesearchaeota archaeon]